MKYLFFVWLFFGCAYFFLQKILRIPKRYSLAVGTKIACFRSKKGYLSRKKGYDTYPEKVRIPKKGIQYLSLLGTKYGIFLSFLAPKKKESFRRHTTYPFSCKAFISVSLYPFAKCRYPLHFVSLIFSGVKTSKDSKAHKQVSLFVCLRRDICSNSQRETDKSCI